MNRIALFVIVIEVSIFVLALVGLIEFLRRLRRRIVGDTGAQTAPASRAVSAPSARPNGGWSDLAAHWTATGSPTSIVAERASIRVGTVTWKNCTTVGAGPGGLHLAVEVPLLGAMGRRPLDIPWTEIADGGPARLYWKEARRLLVGHPPVATLTLPGTVHAELVRRGHLAR